MPARLHRPSLPRRFVLLTGVATLAGMPLPQHARAQALTPAFDQSLRYQGVAFRVTCDNGGTRNRVRVEPGGLSVDNSPIDREIDGRVVGAVAGDLDADGSPEIYITVAPTGASDATLLAFAANRRRSLSEVFLSTLADHAPEIARSYRGPDRYEVRERRLVRSFTLARPDGSFTQGQLRYRLVRGEASWLLRPVLSAKR